MNLHSQAKLIWGILLACAISGLISGRMVTQDFGSFSSILGWGTQVAPGIVFGLLFSITSAGTYLRGKDHKLFGAIAFVLFFTIASTIIYFIAVQIAIRIILLSNTNSISNSWVAGGLAGLFGAGVLSITAKFLSETRINFRDEILTTMVGTVAGIIFFLWLGDSLQEVNWPLRFVIWQVAVGWSLSRSIQKGITDPINLTENMKQSHNGEIA